MKIRNMVKTSTNLVILKVSASLNSGTVRIIVLDELEANKWYNKLMIKLGIWVL